MKVAPASAEIGVWSRTQPAQPGSNGDWVDVLELPAGRVAISVGDAAGHDERAAGFARQLRNTIRRELLVGAEPDEAVSATVDDLAGRGDFGEMFATAFVAVVDRGTGHLVWVNAGHPPPVLFSATRATDQGHLAEPRELGPTGPIMSDLFAGQSIWSPRRLTMSVGDWMLLYTDGILEARDTAGNQFGTARLLRAQLGDDSPERLLRRLFTDVSTHAVGQTADDRTAAVLGRC